MQRPCVPQVAAGAKRVPPEWGDIHARPRGSPLQELSDRVLLETPTTGWIAIAIDTTKDTLSTTPSGKLLPSA
jgi:hypothetical protein